MKKLIKFFLPILLLNSLFADNMFTREIDEDIEEKHLYLAKSEDVLNMNTVTYLVGVENEQIVNIFKGFADNLGKQNGAINLIYSTQKYKDYMSKSNCSRDSLNKEKQFILYEDRVQKECIPFRITDEQEILDNLIKIEKIVDNPKKMDNLKLRKSLQMTIEGLPFIDENTRKSLNDLVNYLLPL